MKQQAIIRYSVITVWFFYLNPIITGEADEQSHGQMSEIELLARQWVEIREQSSDDRIVLKPMSADIPPARGRRWLDLSQPDRAKLFSADATDKMAAEQGQWSYTDGVLELKMPGWAGSYEIEKIDEQILVIVRKQSPG